MFKSSEYNKIKSIIDELIIEVNQYLFQYIYNVYDSNGDSTILCIKKEEIDLMDKFILEPSHLVKSYTFKCFSAEGGFIEEHNILHLRVTYNERTNNNNSILLATLDLFINKDHSEVVDILNSHFRCSCLQYLSNYVQLSTINNDRVYYLIEMYSELMRNRDAYMPYHMVNVAQLAVKIASELGCSISEIHQLNIASLLHDIGKLHIPVHILHKEDKLTEDEYSIVQEHSIKSFKIVKAAFYEFNKYKELPLIIRGHHERFDGTGYPDQLVGSDIPFLSRILSVADSVDAMLSRRSYKKEMTINQVVKELEQSSGTQFDPIIVKAATSIIKKHTQNKDFFIENYNVFIPNVCLSLSKDTESNYWLVEGNLIHKHDSYIIIPHDEKHLKLVKDLSKLKNGVITFMHENAYKEYQVNVTKIFKGSINIDIGVEKPLDKYFSVIWDGPIELILNEDIFIGKLIRVGGSGIVVECDLNTSNLIKEDHISTIKITLKLVLEKDELTINEIVTIKKMVRFDKKSYFILEYINLSSSKRDFILRFLFRKQMSNRNV